MRLILTVIMLVGLVGCGKGLESPTTVCGVAYEQAFNGVLVKQGTVSGVVFSQSQVTPDGKELLQGGEFMSREDTSCHFGVRDGVAFH